MKIVVPIMPTSLEEAQALELSRFEGADIIEWRADFLDKHSILTGSNIKLFESIHNKGK